MKERAIVISHPEVLRNIAAGRAIQIRIPVTLREFQVTTTRGYDFIFRCQRGLWNDFKTPRLVELHSPLGVAGDALRVREPWKQNPDFPGAKGNAFVAYKAEPGQEPGGWKSPATMPPWAARFRLEVTESTVEKLRAITEDEALAEGYPGLDPEPVAEGGTVYSWRGRSSAPCPLAHFAHVWDEMHPTHKWESDPWVWRCTFKKI